MAISLSCPSCDKTLKVKDELAGRKVKCPGCGEAVPVPAGDEAAIVSAEKLPRGKPLPVEDEEDRPRQPPRDVTLPEHQWRIFEQETEKRFHR